MIRIKIILYGAVFLFFLNSNAQQREFKGNPDTAFKVARELAFNNHRKQAQDTLKLILTKYPNYLDIRSFLASTYSWDGNYNQARKEFKQVLSKDPMRAKTWEAAINNELWGEEPFKALELCKKAISYFPESDAIILLKAKSEEKSHHPQEALLTVNKFLQKFPNNEKVKKYKIDLITKLSYNSIGFKAAIDFYSEVFDPMQLHTLKYSRQTKYGSIIAKLNMSRRFQSNGIQFEIDAYPKIVKGLYAYLNYGFANTFLFPKNRYGGELYLSLPKSFEVSAGFRALKYSTTTTIYTGSIGWYTGNSYWNLRTYITPNDQGSSKSGTLNYRKYRSNADNYFTISAGIGFSPEIDRFRFNGNENVIVNLKSQLIKGGYFFTSKNNRNLWGSNFGLTHQEESFSPGNYFWIYSFAVSWELKFR